ncbi:MAG TPA: signal peptide peptidase SppA [Pirellulaceae bacterium]|nr:signal peptide peptidase SppA [Pirellulaceae bacterium]
MSTPSSPPPLPKRKSSRVAWILVLLLAIGLFISVMMNIGLGLRAAFGAGWSDTQDIAVDEFPRFDEEWSFGSGTTKVVRLSLEGMIFRSIDTGWFGGSYDMTASLLAQIQAAIQDPEVKAILLEIDSPGGAVNPTDEIYRALMAFRASAEGRVIVTHVRDMAASGGYYAAMASDWIYADPTAIIGSIGIIMQTLNWHALSERLGISDVTIKSGANKDMLNPFRESRPEELALLQDVVDDLHLRFVSIVSEARGYTSEELTALADGRVFTAPRALHHGLVDDIGTWRDATAKIAELLDVPEVRLIRYYRQAGFLDWLFRARLPEPVRLLHPVQPPRFLYLWSP